ncbi:hypothetical protein TNCV_4131511 [Trichonephila clavipes]|nr:hypothetical protein TNCV_4131511 [Trichonephila clavipes]
MAAVDCLHHENPSTWAGDEPSTLGAEDITPIQNQYYGEGRYCNTVEDLLHVTSVTISRRRRECINFLWTSPDVPSRRSVRPTRCPGVYWAVPDRSPS